MKSFLLCLSLAGVFALALVARGVSLDVGDFIALGFSALLLGWVLSSYVRSRRLDPLPHSTSPSDRRPRRKVA